MRAIPLDYEKKSQGTLWQLTFDATMPVALRQTGVKRRLLRDSVNSR